MKHIPELSAVASLLIVASAEAHRLCLHALLEPRSPESLSSAQAAEVSDAAFCLFPVLAGQCGEQEHEGVTEALGKLSHSTVASKPAAYFVNCLRSAQCLLAM
jgi:hypothetical protein